MAQPLPLSDILVENSTYSSTHRLKLRLFAEGLLEEKCSKCGVGNEWNGLPLSLHLDHINGKNNDHRIGNLRILCPNCHSQTETYAGKNTKGMRKGGKPKEAVFCKGCGKQVTRTGIRQMCRSCSQKEAQKHRRVVERPSLEVLLAEVEKYGYVKTGEKYGVSDNAVRKWIRKTTKGL